MSSSPSRSTQTRNICLALLIVGWTVAHADRDARAQEPAGPQAPSQASLQAAIDNLGKLDYDTRTAASRLIRRTPPVQAVPALVQAAGEHQDGYVRYRALVLLTGFNNPSTADVMRSALTSSNDRLRTVAYGYFERHPERSMVPRLLGLLDKEDGEFVRPGLVRALAAIGDDQRVADALRWEAGRGEDFFRSAVIEALGDYKAAYAIPQLAAITGIDGPLLDDAALALGKIGDPRAIETLAALQRTAPQSVQPTVSASMCLLGVQCEEHERYLIDVLTGAGSPQAGVRAAAAGLGVLAVAGRLSAATTLLDLGARARDPVRAPIALAAATIALRNTPLLFAALENDPRAERVRLLAEGFDMLDEDLAKEWFFASSRKTYWNASEGSPTRALMQTLIGELDF